MPPAELNQRRQERHPRFEQPYVQRRAGSWLHRHRDERHAAYQGSTVVIKNGTMTASANAGLHFMIKNYGDLTLENVVVQASGLGNGDSTVNNCGNLTVRGANASIAAPQGGYAVTTGNYVVGTHPRTVIEAGASTACIPREASGKRAVLVRIIAALRFPPRLPAVRSDRSASAIGMRRKILLGRLTWDRCYDWDRQRFRS